MKTLAVLYDKENGVIGLIETDIKSGSVKYTYTRTINKDPVNLRTGFLSRSKKAFAEADKTLQNLSILEIEKYFYISE